MIMELGARRHVPMKKVLKKLWRQKYLFLMLIPAIIWIIMFAYVPMVGIYMAFTNYMPGGENFWLDFFNAPFVGLEWFKYFFDSDFLRIMRNTLGMSFLTLIFSFPMPILIAIALNEIKSKHFKKLTQTISYLPYFISWVIAANLILTILGADGIVNQLLKQIGLINESVLFFSNGLGFWFIIALSNTWKGMGYNSIIYLAAISGIPTELYEAAEIDGADKLQKIRYITLPTLKPTIIILLIFSIGGLMSAGFDQQYLMQNSTILDYSEVLDTYTYKYGLQQLMFSYASAVGLFKSVVSFILLFTVNLFAKRVSDTSLF